MNRFRSVTGQKSQVQSIDLSTILKAFVRRGQHKLSAEFQCKKRLLDFDCQDARLTKAFFNLKPTKKQVCWKENVDCYEYTIIILFCLVDLFN